MPIVSRLEPADGTFITPHKADIEDVMNGLCPTNVWHLQEVDLSGFPAVRTDEDID